MYVLDIHDLNLEASSSCRIWNAQKQEFCKSILIRWWILIPQTTFKVYADKEKPYG